jgi:hypothetical protein
MIVITAYWLFLLCASTLIIWKGRRLEHQFMGVFLSGTLLTLVSALVLRERIQELSIILADLAVWFAALYCVVRSDRYWPIWFAAFHANTIAAEAGSLIFASKMPGLYMNLAGAWVFPALGVMAWGILQDGRLMKGPVDTAS